MPVMYVVHNLTRPPISSAMARYAAGSQVNRAMRAGTTRSRTASPYPHGLAVLVRWPTTSWGVKLVLACNWALSPKVGGDD
jgi:hypothetical protein